MKKIEEFLKEFRKTKLGKVVSEYLERIVDEGINHADKKKGQMIDLNRELTTFLGKNMGSFGIEDYNQFKKNHEGDIEEVTLKIKSINPNDLKKPGLRLLHCLGSISLHKDYLLPGQKTKERLLWPSIGESLDKFQVAYADQREKKIFEEEIKSSQHISRYPVKIMNELLNSWARQIDCSLLAQAIDDLNQTIGGEFKDYPDPLSFYQNTSLLYNEEKAKGPIIVFSTTSGLVIPLEYKGKRVRNPKTGKYIKHPYRKSYFDKGIKASLVPIKYQWNPITTGKALKKWIRGDKERKEMAIDHLADFLVFPHIEITETPFEEWKVHFTITSPEFGCVFSQRDKTIKPICHGLLADPKNDKAPLCFKSIGERIGAINRKSFFTMVNECYEKGEKRPIKSLKPYNVKEALELAQETVNNLLKTS